MAKNEFLDLAKDFTLWGARTLVVNAGKQLVDRVAEQVADLNAQTLLNGKPWAKMNETERQEVRATIGNTLTVLAKEGQLLSSNASKARKRKKS